tara:strand:+ start:59 stop:277 length:219 start_codon:yes stop_codon:yes gene_type:complete
VVRLGGDNDGSHGSVHGLFRRALVLQSWEWSFGILKSNYFAGHVLCVAFYLVVGRLPTPTENENENIGKKRV